MPKTHVTASPFAGLGGLWHPPPLPYPNSPPTGPAAALVGKVQSLRLGHSCAQSRAQWDQCGGTCDSRDPGCQWAAMTIDPHCAAARHARGAAAAYNAAVFVVRN